MIINMLPAVALGGIIGVLILFVIEWVGAILRNQPLRASIRIERSMRRRVKIAKELEASEERAMGAIAERTAAQQRFMDNRPTYKIEYRQFNGGGGDIYLYGMNGYMDMRRIHHQNHYAKTVDEMVARYSNKVYGQ